MTYKELLDRLNKLSDSELESTDVTVEIDGEFFAANLKFMPEDDVLDKNHAYLSAVT